MSDLRRELWLAHDMFVNINNYAETLEEARRMAFEAATHLYSVLEPEQPNPDDPFSQMATKLEVIEELEEQLHLVSKQIEHLIAKQIMLQGVVREMCPHEDVSRVGFDISFYQCNRCGLVEPD